MKKATTVAVITIAVSLFFGCAGKTPRPEPKDQLEATIDVPDAAARDDDRAASAATLDGAQLLEARCSSCHRPDKVKGIKKDVAGWNALISDMVAKGARLTPDETVTLAQYLTARP